MLCEISTDFRFRIQNPMHKRTRSHGFATNLQNTVQKQLTSEHAAFRFNVGKVVKRSKGFYCTTLVIRAKDYENITDEEHLNWNLMCESVGFSVEDWGKQFTCKQLVFIIAGLHLNRSKPVATRCVTRPDEMFYFDVAFVKAALCGP